MKSNIFASIHIENNIKISLFYNLARSHITQKKELTQAMDYYNEVLGLNPSHTKALDYIKELLTDPAPLSTRLPMNNEGDTLTNDKLEKRLDEALDVTTSKHKVKFQQS